MALVVTISPGMYIPRRLDGVVTSSKDNVSIEYKEKGQVKTKTKVYPAADLIAYMVGSPGFVVERSAEPITVVVGTASSSGIKTEAGTVIINPAANLLGAVISRQEVDDDSREARAAERAGKVKVKIPVAKSSRDVAMKKRRRNTEEAPAKKKKKKKVAK